MSLLLLLHLLSITPDISKVPPICVDLAGILEEAMEEGYINRQEAVDVLSRCAGQPENSL